LGTVEENQNIFTVPKGDDRHKKKKKTYNIKIKDALLLSEHKIPSLEVVNLPLNIKYRKNYKFKLSYKINVTFKLSNYFFC